MANSSGRFEKIVSPASAIILMLKTSGWPRRSSSPATGSTAIGSISARPRRCILANRLASIRFSRDKCLVVDRGGETCRRSKLFLLMNAKAGCRTDVLVQRPDFAACCSYCLCRFERQGVLGALTAQWVIEFAHERLDAGNRNRVHRQFRHAKAHEQGHGDRVAAKRTAHADPFAVFGRAIRCGLDEAQHGGMQAIGLSGEIGLA